MRAGPSCRRLLLGVALSLVPLAAQTSTETSIVPLAAATSIQQVATPWAGTSYKDLHREYQNIFKHGNRNAASHLWSKFLFERASQMTHERFVHMFSGFCAVSGSPVRPSVYTRYKLTLDKVDGTGKTAGFMYYCCWPCVCDTQDFIRVDTKTVQTQSGERVYRFAVVGNPCDHPEELQKPFQQPFRGREWSTLARDAAEVRCENGVLINAPLSDHGYVIINMFFDLPEQSPENQGALAPSQPVSEPQPGRMSNIGGIQFQDETEFKPMCEDRARNGYNSGMGEIFRKVAGISPISIPSKKDSCLTGDASSDQCSATSNAPKSLA